MRLRPRLLDALLTPRQSGDPPTNKVVQLASFLQRNPKIALVQVSHAAPNTVEGARRLVHDLERLGVAAHRLSIVHDMGPPGAELGNGLYVRVVTVRDASVP